MDLCKAQELTSIENAPMQEKKPATMHSGQNGVHAGTKTGRLLALSTLSCEEKYLSDVKWGGGECA